MNEVNNTKNTNTSYNYSQDRFLDYVKSIFSPHQVSILKSRVSEDFTHDFHVCETVYVDKEKKYNVFIFEGFLISDIVSGSFHLYQVDTLRSYFNEINNIVVGDYREKFVKELISNPNPYELSISLHALEHLGINLYSNVTAVLTEAVANSYDADAENVYINLDVDNDEITIQDDGHGMNVEDMNEKYLTVAYKRRGFDNRLQRSLEKKRLVMGRKGLGKLSLFSIANVIEIQSFKDDKNHGCIMNVHDIRTSMANKDVKYKPLPIDDDKLEVNKGTLIKLRGLKKARLSKTRHHLPQHLSRRFSVIGSADFKVFVNGNEVTSADRGDLKVVEFLWNIGPNSSFHEGRYNILENSSVKNRLDAWESDWEVKGWIGTANLPTDLKSASGNLNGIVVLSRGRLIHENILKEVSDAKHFTHYITGQIEVDFLDEGDDDVATSDRQRLIEDDPRVQQLLVYLKSILNREIEPQWNKWRDKYKTEKLKKQHPAVTEWLNTMDTGLRKEAEKIVTLISKADIEDKDDRKDLLRQGVVAFERLKLQGMSHQLSQAVDVDVKSLLNLIGSIDDLEASLYRDIVKGRLSIIRAFHNDVNENKREKILQESLFEHLWLIDPAWERAAGSEVIETNLRENDGFDDAKLTEEELKGRIDIAYKTYAGKHIIIELKRAKAVTPAVALATQGKKYVNKLKKILLQQGVIEPDIEVVFVVGKPLTEAPDEIKSLMGYVSSGSKIKTYHELIQGALNGYSEYLQQDRKIARLEEIVERF